MTELGTASRPQPAVNVQELCMYLTGRTETVNREALVDGLQYWADEAGKYREISHADRKVLLKLFVLDVQYDVFQRVLEEHRTVYHAELKAAAARLPTAKKAEWQARRAIWMDEQKKIGAEIREKLAQDVPKEALEKQFARLRELMTLLAGPPPVDVKGNRDLHIAQLNLKRTEHQVEGIRLQARSIMSSPEGRDLDYVLPTGKKQFCAALNIPDPSAPLNPHIAYLLEKGDAVDAHILAENRRNKKV